MEALTNWREEKRSAHVYRTLGTLETNPVHKKLFFDLSMATEKQALLWEKQFTATSPGAVSYIPDRRTRFTLLLVRLMGPRAMRLALTAMKIRGMSIYQGQHRDHPFALVDGEIIEHQHRGIKSGNNIRAAIFGLCDGLLSNTSLLLGIAGAAPGPHFILVSGVAGLLAGACSMGAGEYVSVRSQRDMLEYQLRLEKNELELYPEEEAEELALIYHARGIPLDNAKRIAQSQIQDPELALDTLAREELGINPKELVSPLSAALASFFSFAFGAFIPLLPFLFPLNDYTVKIAIGLAALALFCLGAFMSLFTQRSTLIGGLRMLLIGTAMGTLTYCIGSLFGTKN